MTRPVFRRTEAGDMAALKKIWLLAYPGDDIYADIFFEKFYRCEDGFLALEDDSPCGMLFVLKDYIFYTGRASVKAAYIYAVGTIPARRGHGVGSGLTAYAAGVSRADGTDAVFLAPADGSLRQWYRERLGTVDCFYHREINTDILFDGGSVTEIDPETYARHRCRLLEHTAYVEIPLNVLKLQAAFCGVAGGGLYQLDLDGKTGICIAEPDGEHLMIRELLMPDADPVSAAGCMMRELRCADACARTPVFWHPEKGNIAADCVLLPGERPVVCREPFPYWGFLLD